MEKTLIEWCDSTFNPITGCLNGCEYCYARSIANRFKGCLESPDGSFDCETAVLQNRLTARTSDGSIINAAYPYGFTPTLHEYRLKDPVTRGFGKTVFVCSMADMFGDWVPDEWIEKVFASCEEADNHRYLFLTKNPARYIKLVEKGMLPEKENFWYGSTATNTEMPVFWSKKHNTFVSVEPILEPFLDGGAEGFLNKVDWVIFGAETGKRKNKVVPERYWLEEAVEKLKSEGKPVFMKDSLKPIWGEDIITEFPWKD